MDTVWGEVCTLQESRETGCEAVNRKRLPQTPGQGGNTQGGLGARHKATKSANF